MADDEVIDDEAIVDLGDDDLDFGDDDLDLGDDLELEDGLVVEEEMSSHEIE